MSFIGGQIPSGVIFDYAGTTAPQGYLLCYGQLVSRTTYAKLFAAISTTYGVGDGSTTFGLPDTRGRVIAGKDDMGGVAANRLTNAVSGVIGTTLGAAGGTEALTAHTHAATGLFNSTSSVTGTANSGINLTHSHGISDPGHNHNLKMAPAAGGNTDAPPLGNGGSTVQSSAPIISNVTGISINNSGTLDHSHSLSGTAAAQTISGSVASTGAGASQNVQPTIVMNKIIKV